MMFDTQSNTIRPAGRTARRRPGGRALQNVGLTVALISASMICSSASSNISSSASSDSSGSGQGEKRDIMILAKKAALHPKQFGSQFEQVRRFLELLAGLCRDEITDTHVQLIIERKWPNYLVEQRVRHFCNMESYLDERHNYAEEMRKEFWGAKIQMEDAYREYLKTVAARTALDVKDVEQILDVAENDKCQEELHNLFTRYLQYRDVNTAGNYVKLQIYYRKVAAKSTSEDRFGGSDVAIVKSLLTSYDIHPARTIAKKWYRHYQETREVEEPAKWIDGFLRQKARQKANSEDTKSWITLPKVVVGLTLIVMLFTMIM